MRICKRENFIIKLLSFLQVIEISKGSKVKYELDKKTGLIKVNEDDNW